MTTFAHLNKQPVPLFMELINHTNKTNFREGDLNIGVPAPATHATGTHVNTTVTVTGTDRIAFKGPQPLYYRRVDLGTLLFGENLAIKLPEGTTDVTTAQLLPILNDRFKFQLTAADIATNNWSVDPSGSITASLQTLPGSLTYIGGVDLSISLEGEAPVDPTDPEVPDMFNRMLFANRTVTKMTDDLRTYSDVNDPNAPTVIDRLPLSAGTSNGNMIVLQEPEYASILVHYRAGMDAMWNTMVVNGTLRSPYMTVFRDQAYFAYTDWEIDPSGKAGLYRVVYDWDGAQPRFERVLDLWTQGIDMPIQMSVDPIQGILAVSCGYIHYTLNGTNWQKMDLPSAYENYDKAPLPRVLGLGLYDNRLRVLTTAVAGGVGNQGETWEFIFCDEFITDTPGGQREFEVLPWTFGPHGQDGLWNQLSYSQGISWYYGEEGLFVGMGVFTPRRVDGMSMQEDDVVGQIWKLGAMPRKWVRVSNQTGIVDAQFQKLENALVWAGGNNDALGGTENIVISYDGGDTWVNDPSNPNSPFKLEPYVPASITPVTAGGYDGDGPGEIDPYNAIIRRTWGEEQTKQFGGKPVPYTVDGTPWRIVPGTGQFYRFDEWGDMDDSWGGEFYEKNSIPQIHPLPDGKLIVLGGVSVWRGENTGYERIIRLNPDCSVDTTFVEPVLAGFNSFSQIRHLSGGGWVVVGMFFMVNGVNRTYYARLNEDWTVDETWGTVIQFDSYETIQVASIHELPDGNLLMGAAHRGPDRTTKSCWYVLDQATGAPVIDHGYQLGTGRHNPETGASPAIVDVVEAPNGDNWIFAASRCFPNNAFAICFDPTTKETIAEITEGDCAGARHISFVMAEGNWIIINSAAYTGATFETPVHVDYTRVGFYNFNGTMREPGQELFGVFSKQGVGEDAFARIMPINNTGRYLLMGLFGFVEQAGYPRNYREASNNICQVQIDSGET